MKMKLFFSLSTVLMFLLTSSVFAQKSGKGKVVYKYRKYEKFDFSGIDLNGGPDSVGDLSINPRVQKRFKNRLPLRKNFNPELRESIETLR